MDTVYFVFLIVSFPNALKGTRDDNCPSFNSFWRRKTPRARFDQYLIELIQTYFGAQSDYPGKSRRGTEARVSEREGERERKKRGANFTTADKMESAWLRNLSQVDVTTCGAKCQKKVLAMARAQRYILASKKRILGDRNVAHHRIKHFNSPCLSYCSPIQFTPASTLLNPILLNHFMNLI